MVRLARAVQGHICLVWDTLLGARGSSGHQCHGSPFPANQSQTIVRRLGIDSSISVPLIARGRMLGAISLVSERPHAFDEQDVQLVEELARRAAVVIDRARLHTELSRVAQHPSGETAATLPARRSRASRSRLDIGRRES